MKVKACAVAVSCVLMAAQAARAQQAVTLEEIVVTAQKRSQNVQDVPIAITALSGEALKNQHVSDVMDLNQIAPGLQVKADDNAANPKIFIRGVGLNDFNPNTASAVGIYADGVYIGSPLAQMGQFFDIDRLEILRGPQGTLYGRNTTGGTINIVTRKPTQNFEADASVEYGRFNALNFEGAVGGALVKDVLAGRIAATYQTDDGFTNNRLTGHDLNDANRYAVRGSLDFTPSDAFDALVQLRYGKSDGGSFIGYNRSLLPATEEATGPDGLCAPGFYTSGQCTDIAGYGNTSSNRYAGDYHLEGKDEVVTKGASAILTWKFDGASLISVSAFDKADRDDHEDTDVGPNDVITARYRASQKVFSEELRLQSAAEKDQTNWVAGLYYANDKLETDSYYDVLRVFRPFFVAPDNPDGFSPENSVGIFGWPYTQKTESWAAFGQVDYPFTSNWIGTLGLRYSADSKDFHYTATAENAFELFTVDQSKDFGSVSGKAGLQYIINDDANVYFSYNRGYKSGGFFGGQATDPAQLKPYDDEKVDAFEVGAKTTWLEHRLRANLSAFYYDYQDLQVYTLIPEGLITVQSFTNASNAEMYGAEAELSFTPIDHLDLSFSAAYLSAVYKDFISVDTNSDYSGNRLPNAPRTSLSAAASYQWPLFGGALTTAIDATYRSKVYFDTRNLERLSDPERTFVNARIGWNTPDQHFEFGLWGRNLFDTENVSDVVPIEGLGFDSIAMGMPRTYGVYARYKY
jgi:iron complex outermembrane recepter protein